MPGPNRWELVNIADQQQVAALVDGAQQVVHQQDIDHGGFVDDHQVGIQRVFLVAQEWTAGARFEFQQAVDGFGFQPGGFAEAFGGPPGRGRQQHGVIARLEQLDNRAGDGALAGARSAGEHADFVGERHAHGFFLLVGQLDGDLCIQPGEGALPVNGLEVAHPVALRQLNAAQPAGDATLAHEERRQEDSLIGRELIVGIFRDERRLADEHIQLFLTGRDAHLQQAHAFIQQLVASGEAVAFIAQGAEGVQQTGLQAFRCGRGDAHLPGNFVGGAKADAKYIPGKLVGVGAHDTDRTPDRTFCKSARPGWC